MVYDEKCYKCGRSLAVGEDCDCNPPEPEYDPEAHLDDRQPIDMIGMAEFILFGGKGA